MLNIDAIHMREINMPLAYPFETSFGLTTGRRILLIELESDGLTAWGECVAGEHPYFSDETIDTAWLITESELAPRLLDANVERGGSCPDIFRQVRGHRMAKAALENAVWDLEAQVERVSLAELLGGTRTFIPCGVSIGIQPSIPQLMDKIATELAAGYQRIKLKCKPGFDSKVFEAVRKRWPDITLSCDANSAYRMRDLDHIAAWDEFDLLMIEQPLWYDDFYFHSMLQKRLNTAICLDESIRNRRDALAAIDMESCRIINIKVGRVGASAKQSESINAAEERGIPYGAEECSKPASAARTISLYLRCRTSRFPATSLPPAVTGSRTSSSPKSPSVLTERSPSPPPLAAALRCSAIASKPSPFVVRRSTRRRASPPEVALLRQRRRQQHPNRILVTYRLQHLEPLAFTFEWDVQCLHH